MSIFFFFKKCFELLEWHFYEVTGRFHVSITNKFLIHIFISIFGPLGNQKSKSENKISPSWMFYLYNWFLLANLHTWHSSESNISSVLALAKNPFWLTLYLPSERHRARSICTFFHKRFVKFSSSPWMNNRPALFAVILQTRNIGTEEWSKFPSTTGTLAFVTHLVI